MRNLLRLTWVLIRNARNPIATGRRGGLKRILFVLLIALAFLPLMIQFGSLAGKILDVLGPIGQEGILFAFAFSMTCLLILLFGIPSTLVVYYFGTDLDSLLVLPVRPSILMSAKFFTALVVEYAAEALFLLPVFAAYGLHAGFSAPLILAASVLFLLLPVIPVAMASLLVMTAMRFTDLARNRDRFAKTAGVVLMAAVLALNFGLQKAGTSGVDPAGIVAGLVNGGGIWGFLINRLFPACHFAVKAVLAAGSGAGWLNLALFSGASGFAFIALLPAGEKLYLRGVRGGSGRHAAAAGRPGVEGLPRMKAGSAFVTYLDRELKILFRDPVFFMNCVVTNFLWPVFTLFVVLTGTGTTVNRGPGLLTALSGKGVLNAGWLGVGMVLTAMNAIASSAISREGRQIGSLKILPYPFSRQLIAKAGAAVTLGAVGCLLMTAVALAVFGMPVSALPAAAVLMALGMVYAACTGVLIDLFFPKLYWDNAAKAVKQNMNVMIHMALCAVTAGGVFWLVRRTGVGPDVSFWGLVAAFFLIDAGLVRLLSTRGAVVFSRIEA
jgi:ABC-2 type transport system permease protein